MSKTPLSEANDSEPAAPADPGPHPAGSRHRRREAGRKAQAKYRIRLVDELQQTSAAVEERRHACDAAKACLVGLLATHRTLNLRHKQASAAFLDMLRSVHPSPALMSGPSAASSAVERTPSPPRPRSHPCRIDTALYPDVITPPPSARVAPQQPPAVLKETPTGTVFDSRRSPGGCESWSTDHPSAGAPAEPAVEIPDSTAARQITLRLRDARRAAAAAAGVPPAAIRWVLQSPHAAPGGEPLSFTSEFSTPECLTSVYACSYISFLEQAQLAAALGVLDDAAQVEAAGDGGGRGGVQRVLDADALVGGPHATVPADLDTALHGVSDFTETRLMLRCGVSGRVPLRPTLQQAVTTICSSSRRRVPRPLWLRACDMFVQFMAGMTPADCAASTGVCPPARVPAGGAQAHAVSSCPRCCVIVQILQTLREQMQAAMAGEAWEVAPVSKAEVWARCVELYSFNDLLGTQCMTDHPVGFQKMMCCVRADRSGGLEAEQRTMLGLFQQLQMSPEQRETAAEAWGLRVRTCAALDRQFAAALRPLAALLGPSDLVVGTTHHSTHRVRSIRSSGWSDAVRQEPPPSAGRPYSPAVQQIVPSASSATGSPAAADAGGARAGSGAESTAGSRGDDVCICEECAAAIAVRLLGASAHSTASAERALAAVAEVHRRSAATFVEQLRAICMPGVIFTAEQFARQTVLVMQQGVLMDWLWLCKAAADEAHQEALFREMGESCSLV